MGKDGGMGLLCDYFLAQSDDQAAATIDWVGGPSDPPAKRGLLRKTKVEGRPTVSMNGIEPAVMMSTLEHLLTGASVDELISQNARRQVADRHGGERLVMALSPSLQDVLAVADESSLRRVAQPWSQTEEFFGQADPAILGECLLELAALARQALNTGEHLYCWLCV
jgi:hypothetical protein